MEFLEGIKGGIQKLKGKLKKTVVDENVHAIRAGAKGSINWDSDEDWEIADDDD